MKYEVGKVIEYDGHCGKIASQDGEYSFLDVDVEIDTMGVGRYVSFSPEEFQGTKRAFFIKGLEDTLRDEQQRFLDAQ